MAQALKKLVIIGGGFGGLNAAKELAGTSNLEITLIDRRNYHLFQPLLYQVAMAGISATEIAVPIRSILSKYENVKIIMAEVEKVDLANQKVSGKFGSVPYDYLILSCGTQQSYFGKNQWEEYAPGLKSLEQAREIRRRVFHAFELAEVETDPEKQRQLLTFVVVGGGPTGVELAGALGEISRHTLTKEFHNIDARRTRIILLEAGSRILPSFAPEQSANASRDLEKLGVTVWTSTRVTDINAEGVQLGNEFLKASTVLWAAGVAPATINHTLGVELDRQGRIFVEPDMSLKQYPNVFVIGDQAHFKDKKGNPLPGIAPVAIQQGRAIAKSIKNLVAGKKAIPFKYFDKGQMATIGRSNAIVEMGEKIHFSGFFAWVAWLIVHIYYLIGFKNRIIVMIHWFWSYASYGRGARLIEEKEWKLVKDK